MQLSATTLGHRFPGQPWLFTDLSFSLTSGEVAALSGPSGSGKSTLLGILAGWIRPEQGEVTRTGIDRTGWIFQNPVGVARRTALDHVVLPLVARGAIRSAAEAEAAAIIAEFGLADVASRRFMELSGGEAQRLMLARAVAARPDLLLVDEPTAQLDKRSALLVIEALSTLSRAGMVVIIATHDPRVTTACTRSIDLATS